MIKRFDIGAIRFALSINTVIKVVGVNSYLEWGQHILMWDFDDMPLREVRESLHYIQARYFLSDIYILESKPKQNYCAYCFTSVDWQRALEILAATQGIDMKFLKWCAFRGRLTLRVTPKMGRSSHIAAILEGFTTPDAKVEDLKSWVVYETVGGMEYWRRQILSMQNWLIRLTSRLKLRQTKIH